MLGRCRHYFCVVVLVILSVNWPGQGDPEVHLAASLWGRLAPLSGVLLGMLWQLVDRRDLADRLRVPALVFAAAAMLQSAIDRITIRPTGMMLGLGVAAGLILAEYWLRRSMKVTIEGRGDGQATSAVPSSQT